MNCPYCNSPLIDGILSGSRYANTWESKDSSKKPSYIYLKRGNYFKWHPIQNQAFVCPKCNKMIIDLHNEADRKLSKY